MALACRLTTAAFLAAGSFACHAQEPAAAQLLLDGMEQPVALAVRKSAQKTHAQVFVAEAGAGAVSLWESGKSRAERVVAGPPERFANAAPSAIALLNPETLVVAWRLDGEFACLALYSISEDGAAELASVRTSVLDDSTSVGGPLTSFYTGSRFLYAVSTKGAERRLVRARHNSGMLGAFRRVASVAGDEPPSLTVTPEGYLLAASSGLLRFFDPDSVGKAPRLEVDSGLERMQALAFSPLPRPVDRLLYAAGEDGICRLDAAVDRRGRMACRPKRIAEVERPVAMAFGVQGELYVVAEGNSAARGLLYVLQGEL